MADIGRCDAGTTSGEPVAWTKGIVGDVHVTQPPSKPPGGILTDAP